MPETEAVAHSPSATLVSNPQIQPEQGLTTLNGTQSADAAERPPTVPEHRPSPPHLNPATSTLPPQPSQPSQPKPMLSQSPQEPIPAPTVKAEPTTEDPTSASIQPDPPALQSLDLKSEPESSTRPSSATPKPVGPTVKQAARTEVSAKKPPANKKRKVETTQKEAPSARSATPQSGRGGKASGPKARTRDSATPARPSSAVSGRGGGKNDDEDDDDDGAVFCVCRRPDDHTWMIGCDGGCEDWFHGKCINMSERDGKLIDKYICPNCAANGIGETTWKPMCRLETCREPARASGKNPSKYCCDEHGEIFLRQRILERVARDGKQPLAKKKRPNGLDHQATSVSSEPAYLRGGLLQARELKAIVNSVDNLDDFRQLGNRLPGDKDLSSLGASDAMASVLTIREDNQLAGLGEARESIVERQKRADVRERLAELARSRAKTLLDALKKQDRALKDICGYDARLSWTDAELDHWRGSDEGRGMLANGRLGPPPLIPNDSQVDGEGDIQMAEDSDIAPELSRGVCPKKRCERHKQWYRLQMQEIALERDDCRQALRRLDREEGGIRERAQLRRCDEAAAV